MTISSFYRFKRLTYSRWQRIRRWEFWPVWLFYIPIVFYILFLALKYRGGSLFSIANPKMEYGGIFGDDKVSTLDPLSVKYHEAIPETKLLSGSMSEQLLQLKALKAITYPFILKPNKGYRGIGVKIIRDFNQMEQYFSDHSHQETLFQEYIVGREFGIFYMREPDKDKGFLYSISEKTFVKIIGDGKKTIEELIFAHPRAVFMASYFIEAHKEKRLKVLAANEEYHLVDIGSHCRGSVFLDANHFYSNALQARIEEFARAIPEFYFGRFDLRCPTEQELVAGKNIKVLEVNGVTSESADIYDPKNSLFKAYKVMFKQWDWAFKIGKQNFQKGATPISLIKIWKKFRQKNTVKEPTNKEDIGN